MRSQQEAINWLNNSIGKQYDFDGYYGFQCFDYSAAYFHYVTGFRLAGEGAKDIPFANNLNGIATVFKNSINFIAQPGDVVVWGNNFGNGFGHTAVVIAADYYSITVIEQNWLNGGWTDGIKKGGRGWEVATKRIHAYETQMWFVRPKYAANKLVSKVSRTVKRAPGKTAIKPNVTTWQVNKYGTRWKKESATFTALHDIRTRYTGPFRNMKQAGVFKKGRSQKYDEVMVQDGHVWIAWTENGNRIYMPIRTHNANKDGILWGTIK